MVLSTPRSTQPISLRNRGSFAPAANARYVLAPIFRFAKPIKLELRSFRRRDRFRFFNL